jgi:hypothetical protein
MGVTRAKPHYRKTSLSQASAENADELTVVDIIMRLR